MYNLSKALTIGCIKLLCKLGFLFFFSPTSITQVLNSYLSMSQTIKTIMDSKHGVALDDAHLHCCTDRSIHASTRSPDIHNGHVDVALPLGEKQPRCQCGARIS